ncbi:MAG: hypothetical protein V3S09_06710, partial [Candidatus Bathyarchaeia archaeon]
ETRVKRPSALSFGMGALVSTGRAASSILDELTEGGGSTLGLGVVSVVVLVFAFFEFMNLRKWISGR